MFSPYELIPLGLGLLIILFGIKVIICRKIVLSQGRNWLSPKYWRNLSRYQTQEYNQEITWNSLFSMKDVDWQMKTYTGNKAVVYGTITILIGVIVIILGSYLVNVILSLKAEGLYS